MKFKKPRLRVKWFYSCKKCTNEPLFENMKQYWSHYFSIHVLSQKKKSKRKDWLYACINCPNTKRGQGFANKELIKEHAKKHHFMHVSKQK